jgi:hypothetical protein
MGWTVEKLNATVDAEVEALPEDMRARLARIAKLIEEKGLERVGEPHVKHVEGRPREMRLKGHSGISRALYVAAAGRPGGDCSGVREENGEDARAGDSPRLVSGEIGSMIEV